MNVVRRSERQRQELLPAWGHLLIDRGQPRGRRRVLAHQSNDIDKIALTEGFQRAREAKQVS